MDAVLEELNVQYTNTEREPFITKLSYNNRWILSVEVNLACKQSAIRFNQLNQVLKEVGIVENQNFFFNGEKSTLEIGVKSIFLSPYGASAINSDAINNFFGNLSHWGLIDGDNADFQQFKRRFIKKIGQDYTQDKDVVNLPFQPFHIVSDQDKSVVQNIICLPIKDPYTKKIIPYSFIVFKDDDGYAAFTWELSEGGLERKLFEKYVLEPHSSADLFSQPRDWIRNSGAHTIPTNFVASVSQGKKEVGIPAILTRGKSVRSQSIQQRVDAIKRRASAHKSSAAGKVTLPSYEAIQEIYGDWVVGLEQITPLDLLDAIEAQSEDSTRYGFYGLRKNMLVEMEKSENDAFTIVRSGADAEVLGLFQKSTPELESLRVNLQKEVDRIYREKHPAEVGEWNVRLKNSYASMNNLTVLGSVNRR